MNDLECAFAKDRICSQNCVAYKSWWIRGWEYVKCKRGNFMIKDKPDDAR